MTYRGVQVKVVDRSGDTLWVRYMKGPRKGQIVAVSADSVQ